MAKVGTLKNPPADWRDMFFPEALAGEGMLVMPDLILGILRVAACSKDGCQAQGVHARSSSAASLAPQDES